MSGVFVYVVCSHHTRSAPKIVDVYACYLFEWHRSSTKPDIASVEPLYDSTEKNGE